MYYTYILQLVNQKLYCGYSKNLRQRLSEHLTRKVSATMKCQPAKLIFYAAFFSKKKALQFEKYLKSSSGLAFRNKHLI